MNGFWTDLGRMAYSPCTALQRQVLEKVSAGEQSHTLLFVEHDPVLTLGASYKESHLLLPKEAYAARGIDVQPTDRGGDVTFHGPKQLVAYPVFGLDIVGRDLHKWLRDLEEAVIQAIAEFGLKGYRYPPHTGVWVNGAKICAIGIKVKRWVSMHGIALNCDNDLGPFDLIVPCGIKGLGVTSIARETKKTITKDDARTAVIRAFEKVFGISLGELNRDDLISRLSVKA